MNRSEPLMAQAAGLSTSPIRSRDGVKPDSISEISLSAALVRSRIAVTAAAASTEIVERRGLPQRSGGQFHRDRLRAPDRAAFRQC
jgi:hypothetical protein